jgi:hypothetical protein
MNEEDLKYFKSSKEAVEVISSLLRKSDWVTLSRYYDLSGSDIDRKELETGRLFVRTEKPDAAHPGGFWQYKAPFSPGFKYAHQEPEGEDIVRVHLRIEIDQGGGMVQEGLDSFRMRKTPKGYQILLNNE